MLSSLSYAILALLAAKPQSGYDLAREMKPPLGILWQAKHGQIYPELARLVKLGLVEVERIDTRSGPPRRVHAITSAGKAELAAWIVKSPQTRPANDEFVIKAYALRRVPAPSAEALLWEQLQSHERRLAALEQLFAATKARMPSRAAFESPRFGEYAALRRAIGFEREQAAWCRWLLDEVTSTRKDGGRSRRPRQPAVGRSAAARRR
ncbi:MAG TPA: PadR family transcriptional regulator [Candidatus Dormibacteraeota bacterium]|nr:PadR family transcriptional regulator [Candidatus Dormibacteraeota bacterium]